jgi:hypothetical protein
MSEETERLERLLKVHLEYFYKDVEHYKTGSFTEDRLINDLEDIKKVKDRIIMAGFRDKANKED